MKRPYYHIRHLALAILPVIMTVAAAMAQVPVWDGQSPIYQGETTTFGV